MKSLLKWFGESISPQKEKNIKCVVVGDTAVGKTKLIGSFIYDKPKVHVDQLKQNTHVPSIFASDVKTTKQIIISIENISIRLSIVDTFGDHEKDREYSYKDADVVVICFSIGLLSSLDNVNSKWYPEVKFFCPKAPIILVGTQNDRRHNNPQLYSNRNPKNKTLREYLSCEPSKILPNEVIDVDVCRLIAGLINADNYMETSVSTKHGVSSVFHNAAKLGVHKKIKSRIDIMKKSLLQIPYLPAKDECPVIEVPALTYDKILFTKLFSPCKPGYLSDILFCVNGRNLSAHSIVLMLASPLFFELFTAIDSISKGSEYVYKSNLLYETTLCNSSKTCSLPRGFKSVSLVNAGSSCMIEVEDIHHREFTQILEFYYTGGIQNFDNANRLLVVTDFLQLGVMFEYIFNVVTGKPVDMLDIMRANVLSTGHKMLCKHLLSDITFNVNCEMVPAHRVILTQRSEMLRAMFEGSFIEGHCKQVDFQNTNLESFLAVLEYLYTGGCDYYGDLHGTLQLANFLCLPRLVALCEVQIVKYITEMLDDGNREVYSMVLASYNIAEIHNAPQLSAWCLHFMATNYNQMCKEESKQMKLLNESTLKYLEEHRWPPVWYLKEQDYYERTIMELEREQDIKRNKKRRKKHKTCF